MRLIDADALKEVIFSKTNGMEDLWDTAGVLNAINKAPTVEPDKPLFSEIVFLERSQGEWTDLSTDGRHTGWIACSVCGQEPPNESNLRTDFCPNCGADMRGGENEKVDK